MKKKRNAFTLIEMVIVLFIISLLLLIMVPNLAAQKTNADHKSNEAFRTTLRTQTELYLENDEDKPEDKVTIGKLQEKGYVTKEQVKHAETMKIGNDLVKELEIKTDAPKS